MSGFVLLLTTVADRVEADAIARALVEERLAACVQIGEVDSVYRWQGAVEQAHEHRLEVKTTAARAAAAKARIRALHSYDLPEIVTVSIEGSADYLEWIRRETGV